MSQLHCIVRPSKYGYIGHVRAFSQDGKYLWQKSTYVDCLTKEEAKRQAEIFAKIIVENQFYSEIKEEV